MHEKGVIFSTSKLQSDNHRQQPMDPVCPSARKSLGGTDIKAGKVFGGVYQDYCLPASRRHQGLPVASPPAP